MPSEYLGSQRSTALYQLLGLVYAVTIYPFVLAIGLIGGLVGMVVDVVMGLLFNRGLDRGDSTITDWAMRLFMWPIDQLKWIVTGSGSFPFLP